MSGQLNRRNPQPVARVQGRGGGRGRAQEEKPHVEKFQSVLKSFPLSAQFASKGHRPVPDYPCPSTSLSFDVVGNHLAWSISLKANIKVPAPKKSHTAELDFYQGEKNYVIDFKSSRETNEDGDKDINAPGFVLEWNTGRGVGCGVQIP